MLKIAVVEDAQLYLKYVSASISKQRQLQLLIRHNHELLLKTLLLLI